MKQTEIISTPAAPAAIGPYSQAIKTGGLLFLSGQIALDPATGAIAGKTIEEQTARVIDNIAAVLAAGGSGLERVVKTTCFLQNMGDFAAFNAVYAERFISLPARSCVEVSALPKGSLVEIEVTALCD